MGLFLCGLGRILATLGYKPATMTAFRSFSFSEWMTQIEFVKRNRIKEAAVSGRFSHVTDCNSGNSSSPH